MNIFNALLTWKTFKWLTRPCSRLDSPFTDPLKTEAEYKVVADAYIAAAQQRAAKTTLDEFSLVKAVDLKAGDVIIHEYSRFRITECGCGYFSGNEFGDYFWIKGHYLHGNPTDPKLQKDFWAFQCCPVIKCAMDGASTRPEHIL